MNEINKSARVQTRGAYETNATLRKMTSVALIAIMVAGGLTFAVPGMEPVYAAQINSNDNLRVSAEGQNNNNEIAATNVIEVTVIDSNIDESDDPMPLIKVDGNTLAMAFYSGAWYGYFADDDIVESGLIEYMNTNGDRLSDTDIQTNINALVANASIEFDADNYVQMFNLDEEFDVIYERPGGDQVVSMTYDDPTSDVSLDRNEYPQMSNVVITIDDLALNVDPTTEDVWYLSDQGMSAYGSIDVIQAYVAAENTKQGKLDTANTVMMDAIPDSPDEARQTAKLALDAETAAADVIINGLVSLQSEVERLKGLYGVGDRDSNDVASNDYKGTKRIAFEQQYGIGDRSSQDVDSLNYVGTAQAEYEAIAGRGDRTSETEASPNYKGSALMTYQETAGNPQAQMGSDAYKGSAQVEYETEISDAGTLPEDGVNGIDAFGWEHNGITSCDSSDCIIIDGDTWVKFIESDDNDTMFTNTMNDMSSIMTTMDAQRGLSFTVQYGDDSETSGIAYGNTRIRVDAGEDWSSGSQVEIRLTDSDRNTNSLMEDDLMLGEYHDVLPIITIGEPFTLSNTDHSQRHMLTGMISASEQGNLNIPTDFRGTHILSYDIEALGEDGTIELNGESVVRSFNDKRGMIDVTSYIMEPDFEVTITYSGDGSDDGMIVADILSFGLAGNDLATTINNAIYRLELEEDGDNSSDFIGTLEYIGLNQINILDSTTYDNIMTLGNEIVFISNEDSVSIDYLDLNTNGDERSFTVTADTPTHSGSVILDAEGYKVADTVTITVEDTDLNVDSKKPDIYTSYMDKISSMDAVVELLTVSFDDNLWESGCDGMGGLSASDFTLRETSSDSGVFTGTFAMPESYCGPNNEPTGVTGTDITVEYTDFRDASGSLITVSDAVGIRSNTGSISLDKTVYPVPFGSDGFETHANGMTLPAGDLTVYIRVDDSDFDRSANGIDTIETAEVTISILRGSDDHLIKVVGDSAEDALRETEPDSGVFEYKLMLAYDDGPSDEECPRGTDGCIMQGDILHVEYADPTDSSGSENTVTDSATFDLRNGILQTDSSGYLIGSEAIITLIDQDLNLDSEETETYSLDLIEWDSDAGTALLSNNVFDATPSNLLETGANTGIFQTVIQIPEEVDDDKLERGEEITLEYIDWGPSGSEYVGDKEEKIEAVIYTSNFGATITLDQRIYTWTDKVYITVVAPDHNIDSDQVDEIGNDDDYPVRISTRGNELEEYKLVETGADTGIFTGEVILTGFAHDADGDGNDDKTDARASGRGPTDGQIGTESESGISASFKYSEGETVSTSSLIRWNVGEVEWLEASYSTIDAGIVRVVDPDMNLNPEAVDNFGITVWSDTDGGGIKLTVTETNAATGIFEGTVFFGPDVDTDGHRLRVAEGDTVTAQYYDNTLPDPFKETERLRIGSNALIGTIVPPLERAPIDNLRAIDSFGNLMESITVDNQVQIAADLTNGQDREQEFAYLIQIQDENGITVSLNWITGALSAEQSLSPASSWTPASPGTYAVTGFVWESIENPTALSPTATIAVTVN